MSLNGAPSWAANCNWQPFQNDSNEYIPAHGIFLCSGLNTDVTGNIIIRASKPTGHDGDHHNHYINGWTPVPPGGRGVCTRDRAIVRYDSSAGAPSAGQAWGPSNNSWYITRRYGGFKALALFNTTRNLGLFEPASHIIIDGLLENDLGPGGSVALSVYDAGGDTGYDVTVNDPGIVKAGQYIEAGQTVIAAWADLRNAWIMMQSTDCALDDGSSMGA